MRLGGAVLLMMLLLTGSTGCGTTRVTDTPRAATEMLLVSQAVDNAIGQIDFRALKGKPVYLDSQYIDLAVDKGYVISSVRQHLLAHGALLLDAKEKADYVVELRAGAVGTDKHSLLIGTPQMSLPSVLLPGIPTAVPEIALVKKTDQKGVAKLAVFAYNRHTGRALWQSGLVEANSTLKDTWVFGAGPISSGSIRREREFAGETLPKLPLPFTDDKDEVEPVPTIVPTQALLFPGSDRPAPAPLGAIALIGPVAAIDRETVPPAPAGPAQVIPPTGPVAPPTIVPVGNVQPPSGPVPKPN
jgi:hypothetical protein